MDDCETQASHMMASANALNQLNTDLRMADDAAKLDDFVCPTLFAGLSTKERALFLKGVYHILSHCVDTQDRKGIHMFCNTGNAYGAAAGGSVARSLNGHCFAGTCVTLKQCPDEPMYSILEGTKWVMPLTAAGLKHADVQSLKECNEISSLLVEITKLPSLDPSMDVGSTLLQIYQDKGQNFYASVYISDDKLMLRESVPGQKNSPLALGVPVAYLAHNVSAMRPITMQYALATMHLQNTSPELASKLGKLDIKNKVLGVAMEETMPAWTMAEWQRNVFDTYLPCAVLYECPQTLSMLKEDAKDAELYCSMTFTHEALKGKLENPKGYVQNILAILHDGGAPPITALHSQRILEASPFQGISLTEEQKQKLRTFDPAKANASIEGKLKGLMQVARICTCMGCVTTLVVAKKQDLPAIKESLVAWAKPIVAAQQLKANLAAEWRFELFGGQ